MVDWNDKQGFGKKSVPPPDVPQPVPPYTAEDYEKLLAEKEGMIQTLMDQLNKCAVELKDTREYYMAVLGVTSQLLRSANDNLLLVRAKENLNHGN